MLARVSVLRSWRIAASFLMLTSLCASAATVKSDPSDEEIEKITQEFRSERVCFRQSPGSVYLPPDGEDPGVR